MIQQIVIAITFFAAIIYIGRIVYRSFQAKSNCTTGCAKCNTVDFSKIEKQLRARAFEK